MKRLGGFLVVTAFLMAAMLSGMAYSEGFGYRHGAHGVLVPLIAARMISPQTVHSAVAADRANLKNLRSQVRAAHQQLVNDLVAGNDTTNDVAALETARNNLLAEKVKLARTILGSLSASQRAQVSQFLSAWNSMRQAQRQERMQLLHSFAGENSAKQ